VILLIGKTAYWVITSAFILGAIIQWRNLRKYTPWEPPSTLRNHRGEVLSSASVLFSEPGRQYNRLLSAEATVRRDSGWKRIGDGFAGALTGAAWGWFGVWISSVSSTPLQIAIIAACGALMAWQYVIDMHSAHITYVCADGFGIISARVSRWRTLLPRSMADRSHAFADFVVAIPDESQLVLYESDGTLVSRSTLRRPADIRAGDWQRWIGAVSCAFEDVRWSRALSHLAMYHSNGMRDLPASARILTAFKFDIVSLLGSKSLYGPGFTRCQDGIAVQTPTGRLGFAAEGLLFENWTPLYDALVDPETVSEVVLRAREPFGGVEATDEVREILEAWQRDHVQVFPLASIESVDERDKYFVIRMTNGQILEFDRSQVVGYPTLWRLIQSAIWRDGIEEQLRRELASDLNQIGGATATASIPDVVFGDRLPMHRAQVWYAAFKLRIDEEQGWNIGSVSTVVFRDSCRALGRTYMGPVAPSYLEEGGDTRTEIEDSQLREKSLSDEHDREVHTAHRPESPEVPNTDA
jgi:hypothetical protein